jgi:CRP-like cAMP-binding protein
MATGEGAGAASGRDIEVLRSTSLFAGWTDDELRRVDAVADEIEVDAGEVVVSADAPFESTFVVLDGGLVVTVGHETVARIARGNWIGGAESDVPDVAAVRALVASRLLVIDPTALAALANRPGAAIPAARLHRRAEWPRDPSDERSGTDE